jgi:membrane protease YdiL (CAAX protease family)
VAVFRRVAVFYVLAIVLSWTWWGVMIWRGEIVGPSSNDSHLPGLMGPLLAATLTTFAFDGREGFLHLLGSWFRWPKRPWVVLGLILLPLLIAALWFFGRSIAGYALPSTSDFLSYPGLGADFSTPVGLLIVLILNGYGEEAGWRGFLLETLLPAMGRFRATGLVAAVWLLWHLPLFWVNANMAAMVGPQLIGWVIGLVLGSFAMSHLYLLSGRSVLALAIWHVGYNFSVATPATNGVVAAIVSTVVMIWGAGVLIVWTRRNSNPAPTL